MESGIIKKRMNRVCLAILVFIGLLGVLQSVQIFLGELLYSILGDDSRVAEVLSQIFLALSYFISYLFSFLIFKKAYAKDYLPVRSEASMGAHPVPMVFSALAICLAASHLVGFFSDGSSGVVIYHGESIVLFMLTTVLIPAFCEELFFRGLIMTNLMPLGRNFAIIASGIIFGLVHGNHDQILFATVAGITFGFMYAETGTIWCGVIAHMLNNFISVAETVIWGTLKAGTAVKMSIIIESVIMVCGIASIIYLLPRLKKEKNEEFNGGCFGSLTNRLLDEGVKYSVSDYLKGFFAPAMIAFLCYVTVSEVLYVLII